MNELLIDRVFVLPDGTTVTAIARRRMAVDVGPRGIYAAGSLDPAAVILHRGLHTEVHSLESEEHTLESLSSAFPELAIS